MWQRFLEESRRAILNAQQEAVQSNSAQVETGHLLMGLLLDGQCTATQILQKQNNAPDKLWAELSSPVDARMVELEIPPLQIEELAEEYRVDPALIRRLEQALLLKMREHFQSQPAQTEVPLSKETKRVLELAAEEARETQRLAGHKSYIGTEHILLGLLRAHDSTAAATLNRLGFTLEAMRATVVEHLKAGGSS